MDYLGFVDDSLVQPISETMDDEMENETENGAENGFGSESDLNQISIRFQSGGFPTPARINTDIDKDNILLEGEAGAHHTVEGGGAGSVQPSAMPPELWAKECIRHLVAQRRPAEQSEWNFKARSRVSCRS